MKRMKWILMAAATAVLLLGAAGSLQAQEAYSGGYATIGSQVWMDKNLDVATFRNGDPIPQAKSAEEWMRARSAKQPAWCYYMYDASKGGQYGKLYNWYAVSDPRGLAPEGWHIPTIEEYDSLVAFLGGEVEGGHKLKATDGWKKYKGNNGNGSNESGFNGLPGGFADNNGDFQSLNMYGHWWSASQDPKAQASAGNTYHFILKHHNLGCGIGSAHKGLYFPGYGMSVRCVKD